MKRWDKRAAKRPDYMIANSSYTQANILKYYKRESTVIFPPVETSRFKLKKLGENKPRHGFVAAGRQTPYKRFDLAIEACNELAVPLVVIGDGPDHKRLEKLAGRNVTFLTNVNDSEIVDHFQTSIAFIMPNADDFGIVAVEALSAGTPVVAYNKGGSEDYLIPNTNGIFFERLTKKSLINALEKVSNKAWDYNKVSSSAERYSTENFRTNIKEFVKKCMKDVS